MKTKGYSLNITVEWVANYKYTVKWLYMQLKTFIMMCKYMYHWLRYFDIINIKKYSIINESLPASHMCSLEVFMMYNHIAYVFIE